MCELGVLLICLVRGILSSGQTIAAFQYDISQHWTLGTHVASGVMCWGMLCIVGSNLKMVKFFYTTLVGVAWCCSRLARFIRLQTSSRHFGHTCRQFFTKAIENSIYWSAVHGSLAFFSHALRISLFPTWSPTQSLMFAWSRTGINVNFYNTLLIIDKYCWSVFLTAITVNALLQLEMNIRKQQLNENEWTFLSGYKAKSLFYIKWDLTTFKLLMIQFNFILQKKFFTTDIVAFVVTVHWLRQEVKFQTFFEAIFLKPVFPDTKVVFVSFAFGKILVKC